MLKTGSCWRAVPLLLALLVPIAAPAAQAFGFPDVARIAKALAAKAYQPPPAVPAFLEQLKYNEYQEIRFLPADSLWRGHGNFEVMLVAPGEYFKHPVEIDTIDRSGVHKLPFHKQWFAWPSALADRIPGDLGYAGFKLAFPLNKPGAHDQFLVFAGASYFRAVARNENFGLSARGIAVDTGLASGEEFPDFTRFWLVQPDPHARKMRIYALLDGPSLTGAYAFTVIPGAPTRIDVHARLFVRKSIPLLGIAPLTSMFFYGANTPRPLGEWRPAVHDSGGLLVHSGTGEWLWRPLINPVGLQTDYFADDSPKGFGLLQRDTRFADYEDNESRYGNRPSAWVTTDGDWGKGNVVLVEIPSDSEANDNIVAFWTPQKKPAPGQTFDLRYTLGFGAPGSTGEPEARAMATYVGHAPAPGTHTPPKGYRIQVDFAGGKLDGLNPDAKVEGVVTGLDGTAVKQHQVQWVEPDKRWRLSILAVPADGKPLALRAFLKQGANTLSETWSYQLPANNRFTAAGG